MLNNILENIKKFFKEILKDIRKFPIATIFTDVRLLIAIILIAIASIIIFLNMNVWLIIKGVSCVTVFYFIFIWRK